LIKAIWLKIKNFSGLKNVTFLASASLIGNFLAAFFWLYIADVLGAEEYGKIGYLIGIASITSSLTLFGGENSMIVYTAKKINIQFPIYLISILSSIISGIILFFMFSDIGLSIFVLGYVIFILTTSELLGKKLYKSWSYYFVIQKILMIVLSISLYYIIGPSGVLLGIGISFLIFSKRIFRVFNERSIDFKIIKSKLGFIVNQYIINLLGIVRVQIDKLLILPMFGFALLGNYFLGIQIVGLLVIVPGAIFRYLLPEDSTGTNTKNIQILVLFLALIITLIGIFVVPSIVELIFPEFSDSLELIPILSLAVIPAAIKDIFTSRMLSHEKSKFLIITNLYTLIIFIVLIFVFGELFSIVGIAISFVIAQVIYAISLMIMNYKLLNNE